MSIRYLKNGEINYYRWDICIRNSFNSCIYGYSWYLNTVCDNWDALIEGDYESVMPIPKFRRFGLQGIETPSFTSSLGIFSSGLISNDKVEAFFRSIPSKFIFINLSINKFNKVNWGHPVVDHRSHFELDLVKPYPKIVNGYSNSLKEKIARAKKLKLSFLKGIPPGDLLDMVKRNSGRNDPPRLSEEKAKILRMLISTSLRYKIGELSGVYNSFNNLVAAAFFIWSENNALMLYCHSSAEGIQEHALLFLIDHFIQLHSNRFVTLIFDYSGIPGLSDLYNHFGAIESRYQQIKKTRLPFVSDFPKIMKDMSLNR
ncbi:MAG: hypothetical protein JXB00_08215 [Bacteroidales bacterium]|nr:hypothetical protein [Bacteroidales bacterium]